MSEAGTWLPLLVSLALSDNDDDDDDDAALVAAVRPIKLVLALHRRL